MWILRTRSGITIKQLKELLNDWPETKPDGSPNRVLVDTRSLRGMPGVASSAANSSGNLDLAAGTGVPFDCDGETWAP